LNSEIFGDALVMQVAIIFDAYHQEVR